MFNSSLLTLGRTRERHKRPSTEEGTRKSWYTRACAHTHTNVIQPRERRKSCHLRQHMLSEINHTQKNKHCTISLMWNLKKPNPETEGRMAVAGSLGEQETLVQGHELPVLSWRSPGDLPYGTVSTGNGTALPAWRLRRGSPEWYEKPPVIMGRDDGVH